MSSKPPLQDQTELKIKDGDTSCRLRGPSATVIAIITIVALIFGLVFICSKSLDMVGRVLDNATQQQEYQPSGSFSPTAPTQDPDEDRGSRPRSDRSHEQWD
jgi:hypothetical protein